MLLERSRRNRPYCFPYKYYASSKLNNEDQDDVIELDGRTLCYSTDYVKERLPIMRLDVNLNFIEFPKEGFVAHRDKCSERKICAHILNQFPEDKLKNSKLTIYTNYEPCIYCYNALTIMKEKILEIELYYDEMIFAIKTQNDEFNKEIEKSKSKLEEYKKAANQVTHG